MNNLFSNILAALFPRICLVCRIDISAAAYPFHVCRGCLSKIKKLPLQWNKKIFPLDGFFAAAEFSSPLREILHLFKYQGKDYLTSLLVDIWTADWPSPSPEDIDGILPVPMPYWREIFRGYNQAGLLAKELGRRWRKPVFPGILKRKTGKSSQTKLGKNARLENARNSFYINKPSGKLKLPPRILLVDDICTTGATLKICAQLLKKEGAKFVFGSVLAHEK